MTAPGTPAETLSLAQPFGRSLPESQALRETQPADARSAADEALKAPSLSQMGDTAGTEGWTNFLVRILGPGTGANTR